MVTFLTLTRQFFLHTTPIDVINSWGISKMYATQIVKNVNGEDFTMAALVMQVDGFQFQGKVYIALDEGTDYYRIYGEKDGTKIIATNNERMGKKPMGVIQTRLTTIDMEENKIEIYRSADGKVELNVKLEKDTVWLTQNQMAELFGVDRTSIVRHIRNIYKVEELDEISTCAFFAQVRFEGSRKIVRDIPFYNLDMVISVGYRVNSKNATSFRKWATSTYIRHG